MHYETDTSGIRDAKEAVDEAKRQIEIANIQKEIDLLEDQKDLLNEQIDLLDERADKINKFYDEEIKRVEESFNVQIKALEKQRKETESYYESLTKNLETTKSKFQELTELLEKAELSAKLKQLGIDEDALLAGSEEEFEKLKNAYLDIVFKLNEGNDEVLNALRELSGYEGTAPTVLSDSNTELDDMNSKLDASNTSVGNVNTSLGETASKTGEVASNVESVTNSLNEMPESGKVSGLGKEFDTLADSIGKVAKALGIGEDNTVGTLFQAMSNLNTVTLGGESEGIIGQFTLLKQAITDVIDTIGLSEEQAVGSLMGAITQLNAVTLDESIIQQFTSLKTAIDSVTAAISGGGGESSGGEGQGDSGSSKGGESGSKASKGESSGGNSLTGAIEQMGETAAEVIGEPDAEGDGTVIGGFGSMETAVNDVRDAIGTEGSESEGGNSGGETDDTLVGSIEYLGNKTDEEMGESGGDGIIARFEEFRDVIGSADEHIQSINKGLDEIDGKEVECTVKVNIEVSGGQAFTGSAQVLGSMNLNSATYNAKYRGKAHAEGTAEVTGDWGVREGGTTLVGELGQELVVRGSRFFTVGDNGAEFVNLQKGDIVFNHLQTRELLSKGNYVGRGRAVASGTALANGTANDGTIVTLDGKILRPLQPGDEGYDLMKAFEPLVQKMLNGEAEIISNAVFDGQKQMEKWTKEITNNTAINNVTNNRNVQPVIKGGINITCPGITSQEVAKQVGVELNNMFNGLHLDAMQKSMKR